MKGFSAFLDMKKCNDCEIMIMKLIRKSVPENI